MKIIGCDYHPSYQQIAMVDTETGEQTEHRLTHDGGQVLEFYQNLVGPVRVGMEATGNSQWFEGLLAELGHELWIGDAGKIRASVVRKQKTDARDAQHLLQLLIENRFPRLWIPSPTQRDIRQLIIHRHKLVGTRTRVMNELHHLAMNQGLRRKRRLWTKKGREELLALEMMPWASRRRADLLQLLGDLNRTIAELDRAVEKQADAHPDVVLLRTHPGVGAISGLAFVLALGPATRFASGKQVASYFGLIPREHSSGGRQKLGPISKQGNPLVRWLLVEAAGIATRYDPELRQDYLRLAYRKNRSLAKIAIARKLAVRLYWMLRTGAKYPCTVGSYAG
jgi:transposase